MPVAVEMDAAHARALAEDVHRRQRDAGGALLLDHVRRVAAAVAPAARVVAWLHETFEYTPVSEEQLLNQGLSSADLRALRLLTRPVDSRSEALYLSHIRRIAGATGPGADIARHVKRADLADRVRHPAVRPDGWAPPYQLGLDALRPSGLATGSGDR
jgi:hypothetical protein